jgi:FlaA1/EpsC-like NDP-sugar epimerase
MHDMKPLHGKTILVTGGTGSLGQVLVRRILTGEMGEPERVIILSRDEAKQHQMRLEYQRRAVATEEVIYHNFEQRLQFRIGDVRAYPSVASALRNVDIVINAAAMKQVPTCEYFPHEAVLTNISGAENIVRAIEEHVLPIEVVIGVSTDKACGPVNTMGMTKAIQERIFLHGNIRCPNTRLLCVRYGNVLASRGSVIPLFHQQLREGGPLTITTPEMTRFLLSLDAAVETIFAALIHGRRGETWVPKIAAARIVDVASALIDNRPIRQVITGIRPGEKVHEIMVSEDEATRTVDRGKWLAILPILPELRSTPAEPVCLTGPYSSEHTVMTAEETRAMLMENDLLLLDSDESTELLLR